VFILVTEQTIEENLLGTLSAKHELALAALDADSDVDTVDLVGGIPHIERVPRDGLRHLDLMFDLAEEFDTAIDCHIDETDDPQSMYTEHLAALTIEARRPHSLHAYFLLAGVSDTPVIYDVEPTRDGGSSGSRTRASGQRVPPSGSRAFLVSVPAELLAGLKQSEDVQVGDRLVTSGLDGVFPRAMMVATVTTVRRQTVGLFQQIGVMPAVALERTEQVLVVSAQQAPERK
jgi:hypothetical protein